MNPTWRSVQRCGTLDISSKRLNKYRKLIGAPKRVRKVTTAQKQFAQAKDMLTRSKMDAYKQNLAELRKKKIEFPETWRLLDKSERGQKMPDIEPSELIAKIPSESADQG